MEKLFVFIGHRPERNKICLAICSSSEPEKNVHGNVLFRKGVVANTAGVSEMVAFLKATNVIGSHDLSIHENVRYSETKGGLVPCPVSEASNFLIKIITGAIGIVSSVVTTP
ncbi:hypothetical protein A2997_01235 [Candidatus Nomurabacteria bacterium RIFCSPLOWO2_01_FULL_36_10b]|uniref:Uncharacterized protein n=1 Tax=Candidatus Nomurabacteria bacterium RIFCSPLOWO2_01_FULL_36_10b TaxID=1801766 RepID=A0A1F6WQT2_9BACT|nr:MAG: hypothetical protein A2997_01235 [Candidatus Nomurabacteria bacterium RIFCSPLOWO2_01_FULL_36_10b]